MIADHLANAGRYARDPHLAAAFAFLERHDLRHLADGRHEIEGDAVYAVVQRYTSKLAHQGRWEVHRRYADVQVVVEGVERIGVGNSATFVGSGYDPSKDVEFLTGEGDFLRAGAGDFLVLWPGEVHMPGMAFGPPAPVTKVVVKVRID